MSVRYLRTSRIHLPASLGSTGITPLQRYYGRSDFSMAGSSCRRGDNEHRHDAMEISLLHVHGLPTIPPPTTPRRPAIALTRYPSAWRASRSGSRLRQLPAGSPQTQGRIAFVILRTGRSPPVAPHDASRRRSYIRFQAGERVPGGDSHPPDHARSQAHWQGQALRLPLGAEGHVQFPRASSPSLACPCHPRRGRAAGSRTVIQNALWPVSSRPMMSSWMVSVPS